MMPLGYCRKVGSKHHPSPSSECGIMGYSSYTRLENKKERRKVPCFHSQNSTVYFLYHHKIKTSGAKIKLTLEHTRQMEISETHRSFRVGKILVQFCVNLNKYPDFSGFRFPIQWGKNAHNIVSVTINDTASINSYIVITGASVNLTLPEELYYFRMQSCDSQTRIWDNQKEHINVPGATEASSQRIGLFSEYQF